MLNVLINIVDCLVETVARRVIEKITGIKITIPFFSLPRKITSTILNTSIAIDRKDESGACLFQIDDPEIQGSVTPVKSTWDGYSLLTILELKPDREITYYVCISNGDGGVLLHRSELSRDIEGLMAVEETEEGWSDL